MNFETGVCSLPSTKTGPSRRSISAIALGALDELPRGGARVFGGVTYRSLRNRLLAISRAAGIENVRLHDCRPDVCDHRRRRWHERISANGFTRAQECQHERPLR